MNSEYWARYRIAPSTHEMEMSNNIMSYNQAASLAQLRTELGNKDKVAQQSPGCYSVISRLVVHGRLLFPIIVGTVRWNTSICHCSRRLVFTMRVTVEPCRLHTAFFRRILITLRKVSVGVLWFCCRSESRRGCDLESYEILVAIVSGYGIYLQSTFPNFPPDFHSSQPFRIAFLRRQWSLRSQIIFKSFLKSNVRSDTMTVDR